MWNRLEKFSIRKFSFGAASCLIGAQIAISGVTNTAKADGIIAYEANGDKVTAYAHGESVYKLRGTSTSIYNAFWMDVDTSKYTKENPIIKVTLTYNAKDNQTGSAPIFWSGRPMHWFTVPEATEELGRDYKLSLTNGSGNTTEFSDWRSWESNSRFIHSKYKGNPDAWERYNTTTTEMLRKTPFVSLNSEFNKVLGDNNNRWYDNSNMPTQDIMRDLRAKSNSIYIDWEKRAAGTVTVSYTTKVKDPEKTKEITIGMGVYQPSNAQQYARVETIKLPVLYKLNEVFEPKEPERTAVENITNLKDDEIAIIREKIWAANLNNTSTLLSTNNAFKDNLKDSSNSGANSIVIDRTTGKATITYKDDTTDTIEGSNLIYKKPEQPRPVTPATPTTDTVAADGLVTHGNLSFYTNPLEVDDLNKITPSQRNDARERFKKANLTSDGLSEYDTYEGVSKSNLKPKVNFNLPDGPRNRASINFRGNGENFITLTNIKGGGILGTVPKVYLFKEKVKPAFDINAAKEEANNLIESLDNLYPKEKTDYKAAIANATDRDSIEIEVNKAKAKANENAIKLAEMKKEANDKINGLNYLTKEERENAINKINSATIKQGDNNVDSAATNDKRDIDASRDDTRDRLNSIVNELVQQDLQRARQKAIETISSIPNEDLSSDKKTDYINKINAASKIGPASEEGTILNIVEKAQKEASQSEADRKKAEADKVRQQYKDMIANIPGLTNEEKTEYNNAIDAANNVGEMESIVEFAKLTGERKKAIAELGKLEYLNNNQKQSFIDAINDSTTKAELDYYVSQATQLNSKMKHLHDLAVEARKIKPENGAPQDKYTSAAAEKQTAFNNALADAERVLDKANGADEAITSVGKLFTALETAINELKPSEKVTIPADKSALKAEYDKGDSVKKSPAYTKETNPDKKKAYDDALKEAKKVLDQSDASQDAVDKALEDLEVAKAGLNGKQDEFALTKTDENAVAISIEPVKGEIVSKKEDKDLILGKIVGIPTGATVIYNPIVEKANKKYVPVKVTHENVSKEIEIEVIKDEVLNKPATKVKVNNTNKLTEKEKEAVKNAVKQANPTLDENSITVDENGEVTVTYQTRPSKTIAASDTVEAGIASKVIPVVKTAKLSEVPKKDTTVINAKDVKAITDAVTVTVPADQPQDVTKELVDGGKVVPGTNQSADGGTDNTGKLVVKVEVTYKDGSEDVVEVPVEGTDAAKSPLNPPTKVKVDNPNGLTEKEKIAVKAAVKKANDTLQDNQIEVDEKGNVTVTYPDTSTNKLEANKTVEPKTEAEKALEKAKNDAKDKLKEAAEKEIAEIKGDNTLSDDDKKTKLGKVQSEKEKAEKAVEGAATPATVKDETNKGVEAIEKVHTDINKVKEKAKEELEKAAEKEKEDIKADNSLSDSDKKELNDKVDKAKNDAIGEINTATTVKGIEDAKQKGEQAIKAVHQSDLDKKKAEAKKELETAAEAEKKEIESDLTLEQDDKAKKKKEVEDKKEKAEKAVEAADTEEKVTNATTEGKKDIAAVHTVDINKVKEKATANLTEAAEAEKKEIDADNGLTKSEKEALKQKVDKVKKAQETTINEKNTPEEVASATTAGKQAIAGVHTPTDIKDKSKKLTAPQEKVKVKDLNQLTNPEKDDVKKAVKKANPNLNLSDDDITVDGKGNVTTPKGYLLPEDVIVPALNKPTTPVAVKDPNQLTPEEKEEVKKAISEANKDSNLNPDDVRVDATGNVTTDNNGNLPASDVVTQALKKPAKPVEVDNPKKLTDTEKEAVKDAIVEANKDANGNPTVTREQVTVHDDGRVETPIGNLNSEDVVKVKTETTPQGDNTDPAVTLKGEDLVFDLPELSVQDALVAGVVTVEKGQPLTDEEIKKQLVLTEDMVVNSIKKPSTTETGNKEAEVEITLADGSKVTVKVPVVVVESLENANTGNNLAEAKEEAKKHVEDVANKKIEEINNRTDLSDPEKKAATDKVNKAKDDANTQIDNATSSGTAKAIGDAAAENIQNFNPEANNPAGDIDQVDTSKLDEEKAKAIAEIEQAAKDQINAINNNKGLTSSQKAEAIKKIEESKAKAIEDVRKADSVDKVKDIVEKVVGEIKAVNPQPYSGYSYGDDIHSSDAQANAEALANAKESAKNAIEKAAKDKQDEIKDASLSDKEQAELLARVEAEKQAALKAIENAKTVEDVKEAETIGLQAIASVTVPKKPVAPNAAAPQATSAPQATAGTMQDVTYQSPAGKQLPNTGSASSAALASLGLVAATSGFALLGRKTRRRK